MVLLAIDTSTHLVGLALHDGTRVLSELVWYSRDYHTVELAPAVTEILGRSGLSAAAVQALAVATGPGSFTGLRIGLALAKGIALARHIPLIGVPTLDILVAAQPVQAEVLVAVLRAGRGQLAVGWYRAEGETWKGSGDIEVLNAKELTQRITSRTQVCGELTEEERRLFARKRVTVLLASPAQSLRRPSYLAELGWQRWQAGQVSDSAALSPIYLHQSEAIPG
jgi:tRNA threonylcarbamoyladenosine biosynthesis protein TsaB